MSEDIEFNAETYFAAIGAWPRTGSFLRLYITGFVCSLALTLAAYFFAVHAGALSQTVLIVTLMALACVQFVVQAVYFLHLGHKAASRERLIVLGFAVLVVAILTSGSLWIMFTLNGRMMPDAGQMEQYMQNQEGI